MNQDGQRKELIHRCTMARFSAPLLSALASLLGSLIVETNLSMSVGPFEWRLLKKLSTAEGYLFSIP